MDLSKVYGKISWAAKGKGRIMLKTVVQTTLEALGYHTNFLVSTALSKKILELQWVSSIPDDFTLGIHLFSIGGLFKESVEE